MAWFELCSAAEVPSGSAKEFVIGQQIIAVFHTDNRFFALDGMCAHQGGPLAQGAVDGHCLTCPWHGWQYDITNGQNLLTGKQMLETYAIEVRDGTLWIEMEDSH